MGSIDTVIFANLYNNPARLTVHLRNLTVKPGASAGLFEQKKIEVQNSQYYVHELKAMEFWTSLLALLSSALVVQGGQNILCVVQGNASTISGKLLQTEASLEEAGKFLNDANTTLHSSVLPTLDSIQQQEEEIMSSLRAQIEFQAKVTQIPCVEDAHASCNSCYNGSLQLFCKDHLDEALPLEECYNAGVILPSELHAFVSSFATEWSVMYSLPHAVECCHEAGFSCTCTGGYKNGTDCSQQ